MWLKKITKNPVSYPSLPYSKIRFRPLLKLSLNDIIKGFMPLVLIFKKSYKYIIIFVRTFDPVLSIDNEIPHLLG